MWHTIIIVGNLTRDPEMRYTPSGQAVTNLNVAVDDSYNDNQGQRVNRIFQWHITRPQGVDGIAIKRRVNRMDRPRQTCLGAARLP